MRSARSQGRSVRSTGGVSCAATGDPLSFKQDLTGVRCATRVVLLVLRSVFLTIMCGLLCVLAAPIAANAQPTHVDVSVSGNGG
jgi:hypothetical protein